MIGARGSAAAYGGPIAAWRRPLW